MFTTPLTTRPATVEKSTMADGAGRAGEAGGAGAAGRGVACSAAGDGVTFSARDSLATRIRAVRTIPAASPAITSIRETRRRRSIATIFILARAENTRPDLGAKRSHMCYDCKDIQTNMASSIQATRLRKGM